MSNLKTPQGLCVVASAGKPQEEMPKPTNEFEICETGYFTRKYGCGHRGSRWFILSTYGTKTKKIRKKKLCPSCFLAGAKQHIIRCALCGFHIAPGDGVALYAGLHESKLEESGIRSDATWIGRDVVGCMRWLCCPSGGFYAGYWTNEGFRSVFDGGQTIAESAMANR